MMKQQESEGHPIKSTPEDLYIYQRLDKQNASIRLLQLARNGVSSDLECKIIHESLDTAPAFDAISYTWDNTAKTHGIAIDRKWLPTSASVWEIVQQQAPQESTGIEYIWIDFVCINQDDVDEKSWQVNMMGQIYRKAKQVVVCLGDSPNGDAALAIEQVGHLRSQLKEGAESVEDFQTQVSSPDFGKQSASPEWDAFVSLVNHRFWTRVWIVQEVALAQNLRIVYGRQELPWEGFTAVIGAFESVSNEGPLGIPKMAANPPKEGLPFLGVFKIMLITNIRKKVQNAEVITLRYMLEHSSIFAATDPRDHIYGLQGLVTTPIDPDLQPNYKKTVADLFRAVSHHHLQQEDGNWILKLAGIGYEGHNDDLPSWVPDFSHNQRFPSESEATTPPTSMLARLGISQKIAKARPIELVSMPGIITMRIRSVSSLAATISPRLGSDSLQATALQMARGFLEMHSMARVAFPTTYHVTGEPCSEAFWRTLLRTSETDEMADAMRLCYLAWQEGFVLQQTVMEKIFLNPGGNVKASMPGVEKAMEASSSLGTKFTMVMGMRNKPMRFALLKGGYMATVPQGARKADVVVLLKGKPFLFRESYKFGEEGMYQLVGKCYVHGLTASRLLDAGKEVESITVY